MTGQLNYLAANEHANDLRRAAAADHLAAAAARESREASRRTRTVPARSTGLWMLLRRRRTLA
jgi:hypothetical protein